MKRFGKLMRGLFMALVATAGALAPAAADDGTSTILIVTPKPCGEVTATAIEVPIRTQGTVITSGTRRFGGLYESDCYLPGAVSPVFTPMPFYGGFFRPYYAWPYAPFYAASAFGPWGGFYGWPGAFGNLWGGAWGNPWYGSLYAPPSYVSFYGAAITSGDFAGCYHW